MNDDLISRSALLDKSYSTTRPTWDNPYAGGEVVNAEDIENAPAIALDRYTALRVLNDLSSFMYPSYDLFGNKTLVIDRNKFEKVRAKYLDRQGVKKY